jgi:hypothetical protein
MNIQPIQPQPIPAVIKQSAPMIIQPQSTADWMVPPFPCYAGNDGSTGLGLLLDQQSLLMWDNWMHEENQPLITGFPSPPNCDVALAIQHQYPIQNHQQSNSYSLHHPPPPHRISTSSSAPLASSSDLLSHAILSPESVQRFA